MEVVAVSLVARRKPTRGDLVSLVEATAAMQEALVTGAVDDWGEADERFHRELMLLSGNRKLHAVGCQMRDFAKRAHMVAVRLQDDAYRRRSTANHNALIRAILAGESQRAAAQHFEQRQRGEDALVGVVERFNLTSL
jgi:DNA-binding GntR family transcriptional regulator